MHVATEGGVKTDRRQVRRQKMKKLGWQVIDVVCDIIMRRQD